MQRERRELGFGNLDFEFPTRGILFDESASPSFHCRNTKSPAFERGQFISDEGQVWEVTVPMEN